jgi:hypothetical protein
LIICFIFDFHLVFTQIFCFSLFVCCLFIVNFAIEHYQKSWDMNSNFYFSFVAVLFDSIAFCLHVCKECLLCKMKNNIHQHAFVLIQFFTSENKTKRILLAVKITVLINAKNYSNVYSIANIIYTWFYWLLQAFSLYQSTNNIRRLWKHTNKTRSKTQLWTTIQNQNKKQNVLNLNFT